MIVNREDLKTYYEKLNTQYEGYIQMSDRRIENIFETPTILPKWNELHKGINYILEVALYEPNTKMSILIRQQNDTWLILEKKLEGDEPTDSFFTLKDNLKMKISQIWEEEKNEFCNNLEVLEAKYLMFAGFEKKKGESK